LLNRALTRLSTNLISTIFTSLMIKFFGQYLFLLFFLSSVLLFAQNRTIDSLNTLLKTAKEDTSKVRTLHQLCLNYFSSDPEKAKTINSGALELSIKLKDKKGIGNSFHMSGLICNLQGNPDSAIYFHQKALEIRKELRSKKNIAISIGSIGNGYLAKGDFNNALKYFLEATLIAEELSDSIMCANYYNNMGLVYKGILDYDKALLFFEKSLKIKQRKSDQKSIGNTLLNIGMIHALENEYALAENYYNNALSNFIAQDFLPGQAMCYNNMAMIYYSKNQYRAAIDINLKSLAIKEKLGDPIGICSSYINIGSDYYALNNIKKAKEFHLKAFDIARRTGLHEEQLTVLEVLSKDYEASGDYKSALLYERKFSEMKDTVLNTERSQQFAEMQTKYDSEKKDKEIIRQNAEIKEKALETKQKETQRNAFVVGFILVFVLMLYVFNSYRQKKKANIEISKQKQIIENQKHLVEEKNSEITGSIRYAKRIQTSLLPTEKYISRHLDRPR